MIEERQLKTTLAEFPGLFDDMVPVRHPKLETAARFMGFKLWINDRRI